MSEVIDSLIGQSLDYIFQNPDVLKPNQDEGLGEVVSITLRGAYKHEGTIYLMLGEFLELERRYREARHMQIKIVPDDDRKFLRKELIRKCPFLELASGYTGDLYNCDEYIVEGVERE